MFEIRLWNLFFCVMERKSIEEDNWVVGIKRRKDREIIACWNLIECIGMVELEKEEEEEDKNFNE